MSQNSKQQIQVLSWLEDSMEKVLATKVLDALGSIPINLMVEGKDQFLKIVL